MPKKKSPPSYRLHKARGCAVVTIHGNNHYLGEYGSSESYEKYARLITEHFPNGRAGTAGPPASSPRLKVNELVLRYWTEHVQVHYRRDGRPSERQHHIRAALRPLRCLYGNTLARDFGPKALQAVRERIIADGHERRGGLNRNYVNDHIGIVRRLFRWGVSQELVPLSVYQALEAVEGLKNGRDPRVKESEEIRPAPEEHIKAVLQVVSPQIRTMIELQFLTGMRPDEVTIMRPCDIDSEGQIWSYTPASHKMAHRGIRRIIPLGPKAQKILEPWLDRETTAYLFNPREVYAEAMGWSGNGKQLKKKARKTGRGRLPREHYDDESYCQAVERACARAGVPKWTPGQLRHNAATLIRQKHGLEAARLILGHRSSSTTEIYAEKDVQQAKRIVREMG